jgi:hypothetical protein
MELNKSYIFEVKTLKKRKNIHPCFNSLDSTFYSNSDQIGSSFPKSSFCKRSSPSSIRPPSIISANPILKAADQLDKQTASIPWESLSSTLQKSKSNFRKLKEIHHPTNSFKDLKKSSFLKPFPTKITEKFKITRSKLQTKANSRETEKTAPVYRLIENSKSSTLINFNKNTAEEYEQLSLVSFENSDLQNQIRTDTFLPKYYKTPSFHIIKLKRAQVMSFYQNFQSKTPSIVSTFRTAPFCTSLKGKKLQKRNSSQFSLTPNHFLKK